MITQALSLQDAQSIDEVLSHFHGYPEDEIQIRALDAVLSSAGNRKDLVEELLKRGTNPNSTYFIGTSEYSVTKMVCDGYNRNDWSLGLLLKYGADHKAICTHIAELDLGTYSVYFDLSAESTPDRQAILASMAAHQISLINTLVSFCDTEGLDIDFDTLMQANNHLTVSYVKDLVMKRAINEGGFVGGNVNGTGTDGRRVAL